MYSQIWLPAWVHTGIPAGTSAILDVRALAARCGVELSHFNTASLFVRATSFTGTSMKVEWGTVPVDPSGTVAVSADPTNDTWWFQLNNNTNATFTGVGNHRFVYGVRTTSNSGASQSVGEVIPHHALRVKLVPTGMTLFAASMFVQLART